MHIKNLPCQEVESTDCHLIIPNEGLVGIRPAKPSFGGTNRILNLDITKEGLAMMVLAKPSFGVTTTIILGFVFA